jgi:hypothetical protein
MSVAPLATAALWKASTSSRERAWKAMCAGRDAVAASRHVHERPGGVGCPTWKKRPENVT